MRICSLTQHIGLRKKIGVGVIFLVVAMSVMEVSS